MMIDELKALLQNPEIEPFEEEINQLVAELNVDPIKLAAALAKKINDTTPYIKREKKFTANPDAQRFFINVGYLEDLTVKTLIEFICKNVPGVTREHFSDVFIREKYSFFELPKEMIDDVLNNLNGLTIKTKKKACPCTLLVCLDDF